MQRPVSPGVDETNDDHVVVSPVQSRSGSTWNFERDSQRFCDADITKKKSIGVGNSKKSQRRKLTPFRVVWYRRLGWNIYDSKLHNTYEGPFLPRYRFNQPVRLWVFVSWSVPLGMPTTLMASNEKNTKRDSNWSKKVWRQLVRNFLPEGWLISFTL